MSELLFQDTIVSTSSGYEGSRKLDTHWVQENWIHIGRLKCYQGISWFWTTNFSKERVEKNEVVTKSWFIDVE